jgi:hypothetical protein
MVLFCYVFYKYGTLVASEDVEEKMSAQQVSWMRRATAMHAVCTGVPTDVRTWPLSRSQRNHFSVPSSVLTTALLLSAISSLVVAGVLVAIQVCLAKRRRKARVAKLRQFAKARFNKTLKQLVPASNEPKTRQKWLSGTGGGVTTPLPTPAPPVPATGERSTGVQSARPAASLNDDAGQARAQPLTAMGEMGCNSRDSLLVEKSTTFMVPVLPGAASSAPATEHPTQGLPGPAASITSAQIV